MCLSEQCNTMALKYLSFKKLTSYLAFFFLSSIVVFSAMALTVNFPRTFNFKFQFKNEIFQVSELSTDDNEALKIAAQKCFQHYSSKNKLNEEIGLELIDVCANPKS